MISHLRNRCNLFYSMTKNLSVISPKLYSTVVHPISSREKKYLWNIDKVFDKEGTPGEENFFPVFAKLGLITNGQEHSFNVSCDQVIRYMMMGAVNKNITLQYCHYLVSLVKHGDIEHRSYYRQRVFELTSYLQKCSDGILPTKVCGLLCDIASSDASSCSIICDGLEDKALNQNQYSSLLESCHKFGLWNKANFVLGKYSANMTFYTRTFDSAVQGFIKSASDYKNSDLNAEAKAQLKADAFEYLFNLSEICNRDRLYLITKSKNEFVTSLRDFDVQVVVNPQIERSGRCGSCKNLLPTNNDMDTKRVNTIVWNVLKTRIPGEGSHLYAAKNELMKFKDFCQRLNQTDNIPIDCVIDGLNLSYRMAKSTVKFSRTVSDDVKQAVVGYDFDVQVQFVIDSMAKSGLLRDYRKILVICRRHIRNLPGLLDFFRANKIHCFLTDDKSNDDLFQLYAATLNPSCVFVTNDYLRDHMALMPPEARRDVGRWIETHQMYTHPKTMAVTKPSKFEVLPTVDRKQGRFHLPIIDYHVVKGAKQTNQVMQGPPIHLNNAAQTWLCCKLNPSEKVDN